MPIENIVAAAELSATTDPVGNCMGASPRAACATPDHYPGQEKAQRRPQPRQPLVSPRIVMIPPASTTCPSIADDAARDGAVPMIVVTD
ncbi:hypothetical protein [Burkholderia sp. LMG 32019]|uniref:hypothetical protein n=1 Tax=Burkholderia sp. LMG 32019 TaxID=3158173 RepID=UPI003C2BB908